MTGPTRPGPGGSGAGAGGATDPLKPTTELRPPPFREAVAGDLAAMARAKGARWPSVGGAADILTLPGTWAVLLFRVTAALHFAGLRPLSRLCAFANLVLFGCELHGGAVVGPGLVMPHPVGVAFASGVVMGRDVTMLRQIGIGGSGNPRRPGHPTIGDRVWLLDSCKVFGPITIGDDSIVGPNAIVLDDVPPDVMVFGPRRATETRPLAELGLGPYEEGPAASRRPPGHRAEDRPRTATTRDHDRPPVAASGNGTSVSGNGRR